MLLAKVVFFVPYSELLEPAQRLGLEHFDAACLRVEYVHTEHIEQRAQELERDGWDLFIARGAQSERVKNAVQLPVIDFKTSTQAVGRTIFALKRELNTESAKLALIALANTISASTNYGELFGVSLKVYTCNSSAQLKDLVDQARQDGCQAVIGGNTVLNRAQQIDMPGMFLRSDEESIHAAYETAGRVAYAIDLEKRRAAEIDTMLNHAASGIMQVDVNGNICRVNHVCLSILGYSEQALLGKPLSQILPQITQADLDLVAEGKAAVSAFVADVHDCTVVLNAVPIQIDGHADGLILTVQEGDDIRKMDSELRAELSRKGFFARYNFNEFIAVHPETTALVRQAERMAKHVAPIMLTGALDAGADVLAECIHNESQFRHNAFIAVDCSAYSEEELDSLLFGNYTVRKNTADSMAELAQNGTLYLQHVEALSLHAQYKVLKLINGQFLHNGARLSATARVRIIASTEADLARMVQQRQFRSDLYYALNVLQLELTPLKKRRADIPGWFAHYLKYWQAANTRTLRLTEGAQKMVAEYDWPGNLYQINCVCQRIVLLCERQTVGEEFLRSQLDQLASTVAPNTDTVVLYREPKAAEIAALLQQYKGSRTKTAAALGVSKTTLWRYLKKYNLSSEGLD